MEDFYEQYGENGDPEWARYNYPPTAPRNPAADVNWTPGLVSDLADSEGHLPTGGATTPPTTGGGKTPQQIEAEGRDYDRQHGLVGGYMNGNVWVNGSPHTGGIGGGYTPPGDGLTGAGSGPDYSKMLPFSPYEKFGPFAPRNGKFSYDAFAPSSYGDLEQQPGFMDGQDRLRKQIEGGAAYKGMVRSGMTLGDLWTGLDTNKQQRFAEFDSRRFRDWSANRDNALGSFTTNYGVDRDIYDRGSQENDRSNNYRFNTERESFSDALDRWKTMVGSLTQIATKDT